MKFPATWAPGEPIHRQLKHLFREAILASEFNDGQALPTYAQLSRSLSVTEDTLRQAYNDLIREGYALRIKKKGVFVHRRFIVNHLMFKMTSVAQEMREQGYSPESLDLSLKIIQADPWLSKRFERELPFEVVFCRRLYRINGIPVILMELYYPAEVLHHTIAIQNTEFYPVLIQSGFIPTSTEKTMKAVRLGSKYATWLEVKTGSAGGMVDGRTRDQNHQVIEVFIDFVPADRYRFVLI